MCKRKSASKSMLGKSLRKEDLLIYLGRMCNKRKSLKEFQDEKKAMTLALVLTCRKLPTVNSASVGRDSSPIRVRNERLK
jgi:hypothetical protein